jgi:hypothetical protein
MKGVKKVKGVKGHLRLFAASRDRVKELRQLSTSVIGDRNSAMAIGTR